LSEIDPRRYLLSEAGPSHIRGGDPAEELAAGTPQTAPCVVFVAGQPGAGKTTTTETVVDRLRERGTPIVVNSDFYKPYHPEYGQLLAEDDKTAAPPRAPRARHRRRRAIPGPRAESWPDHALDSAAAAEGSRGGLRSMSVQQSARVREVRLVMSVPCSRRRTCA